MYALTDPNKQCAMVTICMVNLGSVLTHDDNHAEESLLTSLFISKFPPSLTLLIKEQVLTICQGLKPAPLEKFPQTDPKTIYFFQPFQVFSPFPLRERISN